MYKPILIITCLFGILLVWTGCSSNSKDTKLNKVGMLVEGTEQNTAWNETGYKGLMEVGEHYDVDIYFRDEVQTEAEITRTVDELVNRGVNLIYGHSSSYGKYFANIASYYPDVHFIYFNGDYTKANLTSLHFKSHAMGFFAGMVAAEMSTTNTVGIIAAHEWQPEIEGFYEGVKFENEDVKVQVNYVHDWNDNATAIRMYEKMVANRVDVFYPAGDEFSTNIITRASADGLYAIGYVTDQSPIDTSKVLTSTVQHVDRLYMLTADKFREGELQGEKLTFDFQNDAISLGPFSDEIPNNVIEKVENAVNVYETTGLLPNEK